MAENEMKGGELSVPQLMQRFYEDHSRREKQEKLGGRIPYMKAIMEYRCPY